MAEASHTATDRQQHHFESIEKYERKHKGSG
jgi:hypothetical protein